METPFSTFKKFKKWPPGGVAAILLETQMGQYQVLAHMSAKNFTNRKGLSIVAPHYVKVSSGPNYIYPSFWPKNENQCAYLAYLAL